MRGKSAETLEALAAHRALRGSATDDPGHPGPDWMLGDALGGGASRPLERWGLAFDALVRPGHLARLARACWAGIRR